MFDLFMQVLTMTSPTLPDDMAKLVADICAVFGYSPDALSENDIEALKAILSAQSVPEGWRLVPIEPTPAMITAMGNEIDEGQIFSSCREAYDAMLSAAPTVKERG